MFAGGAVIAEQLDNPNTQDFVRWIHADPVTGSSQEVEKSGQSYEYLRKELEPLGQEVQAEEPPQTPTGGLDASAFSASSPEWLCPASGEYLNVPVSCQEMMHESRNDVQLKKILASSRTEKNPLKIGLQDSLIKGIATPNLAASQRMSYALTSSDKKDKKKDIDDGEVGRVEIKWEDNDELIESVATFPGQQQDQQKILDDSVSDALDILGKENDCSRAFGFEMINENGTIVSPRKDVTEVAKALGERLILDSISDEKVGIRQQNIDGVGSSVKDAKTGLEYRLFDEAIVNTKGPFFKDGNKFGSYVSTSRAGRALAILHEIAHLIRIGSFKDKGGKTINMYLIPPTDNEEESSEQSQSNSAGIEKACKKELDALNKIK